MVRTIHWIAVPLLLAAAMPDRLVGNQDAAPATRRRPSKSEKLASQIEVALRHGRANRALELLSTRSLRISEARRRSIQGRAHLQLNNYVTARKELLAALRLRPKHARDWYWLGRVYEAAGSPALAAASYEKAYWNGLENAELHHHWARVLSESGEISGAISQLEQRPDTDESPSLGSFVSDGIVIGEVSSRPGRAIVAPQNSALFQVHKALALEPDRAESLLLAGNLWAALSNHAKAVKLFERAAPNLRDRSLIDCHRAWSESALALGEFDAYLEHTTTHMQLSGGVQNAELARSYDKAAAESAGRGDLQRQIRYLMFAVELEPRVDRLIGLADALFSAQRIPDAQPYLQQALELGPTKQQYRQIQERLFRTRIYPAPAYNE